MSFKDNGDLRVRENGWFWGEEELFKTFAPIIGPHGLAVYIAMARLIPLAGVDRDKQIRVRRVMEWACVGRSKCAEEMRRLVNIGLILETKYLDGRDPSYKLASLRSLSRLSQQELMRRAGYAADAPMPFDQREKTSREKELRKQREKQEQIGRPMPLLDDANESNEIGVHSTDTTPEVPGADESVHDTDAVSTTRQHVAATRTHVSAGADTLLTKEEKKREETLNPPTPLSGVEVDDPDQARPALPIEACTFADAGFDRCVPIAADWVMAQRGITKRKLKPTIEAQLSVYCRNNRSTTLEDAAALMDRQSRLLHDDAELLRHRPWGWERWFGEGHWTRRLPYDAAKRYRAQQAGTAPHDDAAAAKENQAYNDRVRKFVYGLAEALKGKQLDGFIGRVREIADNVEELGITEAEAQLGVIEKEIFAILFDAVPAEHRPQLRKEAIAKVGASLNAMNERQRENVIAQAQERILRDRRGLPGLSLFYMYNS